MKYFFFAILMFLSFNAQSQVVHSLIVSRDSILVGDQVVLIHKVQLPIGTTLDKIDYSVMTDSLMATNMITGKKTKAEAEWVGRFTAADDYIIKPTNLSQEAGKMVYQDTFAVSIYQTGSYSIHHPELVLENVETAPEIITTERPQVVAGVTAAFADVVQTHKDSMSLDILKANLAPNANNIFTPKTWKDYLPLFILLLVLLLAALGYFLFKKKNQQEEIVLPRKICQGQAY